MFTMLSRMKNSQLAWAFSSTSKKLNQQFISRERLLLRIRVKLLKIPRCKTQLDKKIKNRIMMSQTNIAQSFYSNSLFQVSTSTYDLIMSYEYTRQDVIVRRWNKERQEFENYPDQQDELAYQEGVRNMDFDKYLGIYPVTHFSMWQALSNYITYDVINRIQNISTNHTILGEEQERRRREQEEKTNGQNQKQQNKPGESEEKGEETKMSEEQAEDELDKYMESLQKEVEKEDKRQEKARKREYQYKDKECIHLICPYKYKGGFWKFILYRYPKAQNLAWYIWLCTYRNQLRQIFNPT